MTFLSRFAYGAMAGLAGAATMHAFRVVWDAATHSKPQHGIFGFDQEADVNSSRMLCRILLKKRISRSAAAKTGIALHYVYGGMVGGCYAAAAHQLPEISSGSGTAFGAALWLVGDEVPIALAGISDPRTKSLASHAGALAAHLLFGAVLETTRIEELKA